MRPLRLLPFLLAALAPLSCGGDGETPADGTLDLSEAPADTAPPVAERYAEVEDGPLNLRAEPNTQAAVLRQLPARARVEVIETGPLDEYEGVQAPWYEVRTAAGETGYVFGSFLTLDVAPPGNGEPAPPRTLALPEPDPELTAGLSTAAALDAAENARAAGGTAEAVDYYLAALEGCAENARAYFELAELYAELEDWEHAAAAGENYIALRPDSFWGHNNLGLFCIRSGDYPRAIAVLERAVKLRPEGGDGVADEALALAYRNLSAAYHANGDPAGARRADERREQL